MINLMSSGIVFLLSGLLSIGCALPGESGDKVAACLPAGISSETFVLIQSPRTSSDSAVKRVTLKEGLIQLGARCKKGKLRDKTGKEIYFFTLTGCWVNPPADYQEILEKQDQELRRLKKKYTLIQITCAQSNNPRLIH
jgi:hypothetical protein